MKESRIALTQQMGERIRAARLAAELSLSQLSEATGGKLSKSRISNYEQGIRRVGVEEASELARALGTVTPGYLLCLDEPSIMSADELALLKDYRGTDTAGRKRLRSQAKEELARTKAGS